MQIDVIEEVKGTQFMQIHGTRYIRHKKRPGIITGALPFRYRNERKPKLTP